MYNNQTMKTCFKKGGHLLQTTAPGFSHLPHTTGSVAIVTVTTTSASFKASSSESITFTSSPPTSSAHLKHRKSIMMWKLSPINTN